MKRAIIIAAVLVSALCASARAQKGPPADPSPAPARAPFANSLLAPSISSAPDGRITSLNPVSVLEAAGQMLPGVQRAPTDAPLPRSESSRAGLSAAVNVLILLTVISLAPSIMLMTTCFMRIAIVLGLLKQAIGTQTVPPSQVIVGLALFMTLLVMTPTLERIHNEAIVPYRQGLVTDPEDLWNRAKQPLRDFMFDQIEATGNWSSLYMVLQYRGVDTSDPSKLTRADVDMVTLVPSYMLSEIKTAFLMGFRVYLPFLVIDMVISGLLISMSMMMLPPVLISLPFKLLLFVMVDGWALVVGSLMASFVNKPVTAATVSAAAGWLSGSSAVT